MKKHIISLLVLGSALLLAEDAYLRISCEGFSKNWKLGIMQIERGDNSNVKTRRYHWISKDKAPSTLIIDYADSPRLTAEWQNYKFEVNTSCDGYLRLHAMGRWMPEGKESPKILLANFRINGKPVKNGTFLQTEKQKNGIVCPKGFVCQKYGRVVKNGGPGGMNAMEVDSFSDFYFTCPVEEDGDTILFELQPKTASE